MRKRKYGSVAGTTGTVISILFGMVLLGCTLWILYLPVMMRSAVSQEFLLPNTSPLSRIRLPDIMEENRTNVSGSSSCRDNNLCMLTMKGDKPGPNQDRAVLSNDNNNIILADGHGLNGHTIAQAVVSELPSRLEDSKNSIAQAFVATDHEVLKLEVAEDSGSTVIGIIRDGSKVSIASAGDSTAYVAVFEPSFRILGTAIRHKPADPAERKRIEKHGGRVSLPRPEIGETTSRVIIPYKSKNRLPSALAMARCMGDREGKERGFLVAEPSIVEVQIPAQGAFAFVASDGVVDFQDENLVLQRIAGALKGGNLPKVCAEIMNESKQLWQDKLGGVYRDDMTLIVRKL